MSVIIKEEHFDRSIIPVSLEGTNLIMNQMMFSVCKIYKVGKNGTGFFCNLPYKSKSIPFLITNNHVLDSEDIENNKDIKISINNGTELKNIKIDESRIVLTNKNLDFTLIEIKQKKDNIDTTKFLEIDEKFNIEDKFLNEIYSKKSIYAIHYPKDDKVAVSYGLLTQINEKEIFHLCSTETGSSGSPILSLKSFKVIGIHYGFKPNRQFNLGTFIRQIVMTLNNYKQNYQNIQNENYNFPSMYNNFEQENITHQYNNFHNLNNNINYHNINFNNNQFNQNNINLIQQNINNNMIINNNNNDIMMIEFNNNSKNDNKVYKEKIPVKIMKNTNSLSVQAFPYDNDFINIILRNDSGYEINIIIPPYKHIYQLFNIYAKINEIKLNKLYFYFNGIQINNYDQRKISQVFNDITTINVRMH